MELTTKKRKNDIFIPKKKTNKYSKTPVKTLNENENILVQLKDEMGVCLAGTFHLQLNTTTNQLQIICNKLINENEDENHPYSFFINQIEISNSLLETLQDQEIFSTEEKIDIIYQPQAKFKVMAVTRCSSSIPGHAGAILDVQCSPNGRYLASGSGDMSVRLWDVNTETPQFECNGHKHWVLFVIWSPCGRKLASGCKNGVVCIWDPETGKQIGRSLEGHRKWIMCITWKPLHLDGSSRYLASSSKDSTIRIWDSTLSTCLLTLSSHTQSVTCLRWSGYGLLYSSSQDRTIKVWDPDKGILCRTLEGHGHWVNHICLNTDYVMRVGCYDPSLATVVKENNNKIIDEERKEKALKLYEEFIKKNSEKMISCSDDHTMYLWQPSIDKKIINKMVGHQQAINEVIFSPDGKIIASASFDKSIKLWNGIDGKYILTLRGHIREVYQVCWSGDSRLLATGSADSTIKIWNKSGKLLFDLPGHQDQVFALDWSPDGERVVSGGKDKVLKIWKR